MDSLPWWTTDTIKSMSDEIEHFKTAVDLDPEYLQTTFSPWSAIESIKVTNAVKAVHRASVEEGAMQGVLTQDEFNQLKSTWFDDSIVFEDVRLEILRKHLRSLKYVLHHIDTPLTLPILLETHRIMMDGDPEAGQLRQCDVHADGHLYLRHDRVESSVRQAIESFNRDRPVNGGIEAAAKLFYDIIHCIHPFKDGNGRLGRMLISYVLMKYRFTHFALPLDNGHSKPEKHFKKCVRYFSRLHQPHRMLELFILECAHRYWENFASNVLHGSER